MSAVIDELEADVDAKSRILGIELQKLAAFLGRNPQYSGHGILIRSAPNSPLDVENDAIRADVNKAFDEFYAAQRKLCDAKP
jgi:hypothetical protein